MKFVSNVIIVKRRNYVCGLRKLNLNFCIFYNLVRFDMIINDIFFEYFKCFKCIFLLVVDLYLELD